MRAAILFGSRAQHGQGVSFVSLWSYISGPFLNNLGHLEIQSPVFLFNLLLALKFHLLFATVELENSLQPLLLVEVFELIRN